MAKKSEYTIATRLTLSGEKEFNTAMKEAAARTKDLNADLDLAKAKFAAGGSETEYLAEKLDILGKQLENKKSQWAAMNEQLEKMREKSAQAQQRVQALENQLALTPQGTAEWEKLKEQLDNARLSATRTSTDLKKLEAATRTTEQTTYELQKEINDTTEALENVGEESEDAGRKLEKNLGDAADETQSKFKKMAQGIKDDLGDIKKMQKLTIAIDLARGAWDTAGQIYNYVQNATTEGMREAISDFNIEQSGGDTAQAQAQRAEYAAIFGDTDSAREAAANLAALNLSVEDYNKAAKAIGGAALKFKDTLKVESLADSLQESISTGALTGNIAEFFERMESQTGLSLETINAGLAEAKAAEAAGDEGAVQKGLLNYLEASGIGDYYESFKQQNEGLIETAEATQSIEETIRDISTELATTVAPLLQTTAERILPPIASTVKSIARLLGGGSLSGAAKEYFDSGDNAIWGGNTIMAATKRNAFETGYAEWALAGKGSLEGAETTDKRLATMSAAELQVYANWMQANGLESSDEMQYITAMQQWYKDQAEQGRTYGATTEELYTDNARLVETNNEENAKYIRAQLEAMGIDVAKAAEAAAENGNEITVQWEDGSTTTVQPWDAKRTKTAVQPTTAGQTSLTLPAKGAIGSTDLAAVTEDLTALAEEGKKTGQEFMQNLAAGTREKMQTVTDAQKETWESVKDIWQQTIEGQVVVGYKTGQTVGSVNQSLTIEPQTVKVDLDSRTLLNVLAEPINVMLNKKIGK